MKFLLGVFIGSILGSAFSVALYACFSFMAWDAFWLADEGIWPAIGRGFIAFSFLFWVFVALSEEYKSSED